VIAKVPPLAALVRAAKTFAAPEARARKPKAT
jgi:hypothetical protein